ncbi:hypothetical protein H0H93_002566 [Arthromyces matolae]|nr:hypothetical protein H0H93_002566 [Arthromyces matolae]
MTSSRSSSLTPLRSPSPSPPTQPDHFYGAADVQLPPSPSSDGKTWLDPEDDPLAHRGIPVFKPTMEEFEDFEKYVSSIECWGAKSGVVKIIPPKEWTNSLPPLKEQLVTAKIRTPIEQHMFGSGGRFRQENMEKRKVMSTREWAELCAKDDFRAPGVGEVGLQARSAYIRPRTRRIKKTETGPDQSSRIKQESVDEDFAGSCSAKDATVLSPPNSIGSPSSPSSQSPLKDDEEDEEIKPQTKKKRVGPSRQAREAALADRAAQDIKFLETFDPHKDWLPPNTTAADYTPEFCQMLERHFWRNLSLGKPAWYGADTAGTLFTDETNVWNVGKLPSALSRLLPADDQALPGVNTPYLYFGMWRATFAWHVEDMDLFSINYIHFGAPKFWYAIPQGRAGALEQAMKGDFLRHKSFVASPTTLAQSSCRPNFLVQHEGEFVITFPRGYHAGFNLGFNCAESVNFALDSWIELGRRAKACECVGDSVTIDVDQLLADRAADADNPPPTPAPPAPAKAKRVAIKKEKAEEAKVSKAKSSKKRKPESSDEEPKSKKLKLKLPSSRPAQPHARTKESIPKLSITLKFSPTEPFPCCLCVSLDKEGLLRVYHPPTRKDIEEAAGNPKEWMAHELCAKIVPETWVDEVEINGAMEKVVCGVDGIVKDRWNLKCSVCTKNRPKAHGAPIQCTKGKCSKAFHVSCARTGAASNVLYNILGEVEKDVLLVAPPESSSTGFAANPEKDAMQVDCHSAQPCPPSAPVPQVLKVIKKFEVQVLCPQHNPIVAAAKKDARQDRIKTELLALPEMARIKLRVSTGVFEVSLLKVNEAAKSVEVIWDKGDKKEFKWSSVIFGNTDIPVQQKPSEIAAKTELVLTGVSGSTYSAVASGSSNIPNSHQPSFGSTSRAQNAHYPYGPPSRYYPDQPANYDYWRYQNAQYPANPYAYSGYYPPSGSTSSSPYNMYAYTSQTSYPYNWQQQNYASQSVVIPASAQGSSSSHDQDRSNTADTQAAHPSKPSDQPSQPQQMTSEVQQALFSNLAALSTLKPGQVEEMLKNNPHLRDVALAAVHGETTMLSSSSS